MAEIARPNISAISARAKKTDRSTGGAHDAWFHIHRAFAIPTSRGRSHRDRRRHELPPGRRIRSPVSRKARDCRGPCAGPPSLGLHQDGTKRPTRDAQPGAGSWDPSTTAPPRRSITATGDAETEPGETGDGSRRLRFHGVDPRPTPRPRRIPRPTATGQALAPGPPCPRGRRPPAWAGGVPLLLQEGFGAAFMRGRERTRRRRGGSSRRGTGPAAPRPARRPPSSAAPATSAWPPPTRWTAPWP